MIGPTASPITLAVVITIFFVGTGYLAYAFGRLDAHGSNKNSGL